MRLIYMRKIFLSISAFFLPLVARAQDLGSGLLNDTAVKNAGYQSGVSVEQIVGVVINAVLSLLGVVFLVLIVYGGYLWMIARGDESKVEKAKDTISRSIIGLVIVLAAYAITYFVLSKILPTGIR
jgi:uncharacterized iron-regulated membrane protein